MNIPFLDLRAAVAVAVAVARVILRARSNRRISC
jgi:hypothetical protein